MKLAQNYLTSGRLTRLLVTLLVLYIFIINYITNDADLSIFCKSMLLMLYAQLTMVSIIDPCTLTQEESAVVQGVNKYPTV